jgi:NAD(P)-dependent dehydrogenase (short-subunit alcohol dehydrogenase family)
MPTIVIVGAGSGLGLSIAKRFGREGFGVALISRTQSKLDDLAAQLGKEGIDAAGFAADVLDRPSLIEALAQVKFQFGSVDVLEYSPAPHAPVPGVEAVHALDVTVENIQPQIEYYLYGAVTAVRQLLPEMIERGRGTLLFSTGGSSAGAVYPPFGNIAIAGGALRNWVLNLHASLADKGVYAAHVPISALIGGGGPGTQPDTIAEVYWDLYTRRDEAEHPYAAQ